MSTRKQGTTDTDARLRMGEAAAQLGVSPDTLRRWAEAGRVEVQLTPGGQRTISQADVRRLAAERRRQGAERPIVAQSARNRFAGVVTRVERDRVAAVVEVQAGPHRLVSLITREASEELDLEPGDEVVCTVKATDVMVEVPSR
ncbi:MAG: helix-turn-helix transcriptional regulator [Chloroflexota bacterium]|jgi:molybdopterin-binding protein